jgi:hypothetical protein
MILSQARRASQVDMRASGLLQRILPVDDDPQSTRIDPFDDQCIFERRSIILTTACKRPIGERADDAQVFTRRHSR